MRPFRNLDPRGPSEAACLRDPHAARLLSRYGARNRPAARTAESEQPYRQAIGEFFAGVRQRKGIPQNDAAASLKVQPRVLSAWEHGRQPIPDAVVAQLVALYGLDPADFDVSAPVIADTADERDLLLAFRHLPEGERTALLAMVRP
ncbi:helix-turn-helix transcriptional regulator [Methylobacterium sp. E-041]|uniref:helix-turn-helix domain-containing protein n=1 Tax=Methylobacterium sp. E-041 TaxID=2836573 RepID=UPI001FBB2B4A|nr:helix-turn-helix transcriptional regulator [Methylobacterium sp. E-041]MCJ2107896.1 helix-turn-helix transcriptional regulator [Methylobacterium sp. E-041]